MAYAHTNSKGTVYYLHSKEVTLKGGKMQRIYYFAKAVDAAFAIDAIPENKMVKENSRTGLPLLAGKK
jgi:hypothetical protein